MDKSQYQTRWGPSFPCDASFVNIVVANEYSCGQGGSTRGDFCWGRDRNHRAVFKSSATECSHPKSSQVPESSRELDSDTPMNHPTQLHHGSSVIIHPLNLFVRVRRHPPAIDTRLDSDIYPVAPQDAIAPGQGAEGACIDRPKPIVVP